MPSSAGSPLEPAPPPPAPATKTFCKAASWTVTGALVLGFTASIKKRGLKPKEPSDEDLEEFRASCEEGLREAFGDAPIPWWAGMSLAAGNLYLSMRLGARKLKPKRPAAAAAPDAAKDAPPPPQIGQAPPARPASSTEIRRGPSSYEALPRIKANV